MNSTLIVTYLIGCIIMAWFVIGTLDEHKQDIKHIPIIQICTISVALILGSWISLFYLAYKSVKESNNE